MSSSLASSSKRMRAEDSSFLDPIKQVLICSSLAEAGDRLKIGTHDGKFHCDEALACAMLMILPEFKDAVIVRTRDAEALNACDVVVDVGGVYEPEKRRFDHHQRGFEHTLEGYDTKLSSAGLVYKHFGRDVLGHLTASASWPSHVSEVVYHKTYKGFIQAIDGIDNGVSISGDAPQKYRITSDLSARVGRLHPEWNEDNSNEV